MIKLYLKSVLITTIIIFFSKNTFSQNNASHRLKMLNPFSSNYTEATLILRNGDSLKGIARVNKTWDATDKVVFKKNKKSKKVHYTYKKLKKIIFSFNENLYENLEIHEYKLSINKKTSEGLILLLELISDGKIKLYRKVDYGMGGIGFENIPNAIASYYYCINNGAVTKIDSLIELSQEIFKDCPELLEKQNKKDFKKHEYKKVFDFYKNNCEK
jgi:hypothetical protein